VLKIAKNFSSKLLIHLNPQIYFFNNENMNIQQNIVWVVDLACERWFTNFVTKSQVQYAKMFVIILNQRW